MNLVNSICFSSRTPTLHQFVRARRRHGCASNYARSSSSSLIFLRRWDRSAVSFDDRSRTRTHWYRATIDTETRWPLDMGI